MSDLKNLILNNRYFLIKELGSGSFSTVWLTFDIDDKKYYALKIQNEEDYEVACHELKVYSYIDALQCRYLMNIKNAFEYKLNNDNDDDNPHVCMVMDLMEGSTHEILKTKQFKDGIPFEIVMSITKQILNALVELHKLNIIHKDIKPENVLIGELTESFSDLRKNMGAEKIVEKYTKIKKGKTCVDKNQIVKELIEKNCTSESESDSESENSDISTSNFKLSLLNDESDNESEETYCEKTYDITKNLTIKLADMGHCILPNVVFPHQTQSNYYLAPELIMKLEYNNTVDMWALGCTIYELLTGEILFESESYNGNTYRHHLYIIAEKLGMYPISSILKCELKDIFFNKRCTCIKGYRGIKFQRPLWKELENICKNNNLKTEEEKLFIDFMMGLFKYDINSRTTAIEALNHKIFKIY